MNQIKNIERHEYEVDIEANINENGFDDSSQDRTPTISSSQSTSCKTSRPQSKIPNELPSYLRPTDDEDSEGSATPPFNRQSLVSDDTSSSSTLTSNTTTPRGSTRSSRASWHYIDSSRYPKNFERNNSLQSRGSRISSIFDLKNSESDPLIPGLLDEISCDQLDRVNELRRQEGRHPSPFALYPLQGQSFL